jgi:hypothetical protein
MNKKKVLSILLVTALGVSLLAGCGDSEDVNAVDYVEDVAVEEATEEVADEPTAIDEEDDEVTDISGNSIGGNEDVTSPELSASDIGVDTSFSGEQEYIVDLNNNGEPDTLYYYTEVDAEDEDNCTAHLIVNGTDYDYAINLYNPLDYFYIIDADTSDNYYEVLVSTYGPSDDLESIWFRLIDGKLVVIGDSEMIPGEGIVADGNGNITIYNRTDILETSFIPVEYEIANDILQPKAVGKETLYTWTGFRDGLITTDINLVVHTERDAGSETVTIPSGTEFDSTTTDNIEWVNVLVDDNEYWLRVSDFQLPDNDNDYTYEVFENLFMAD